MIANGIDFAIVQDHNAVGLLNRGNPLADNELGGLLKTRSQALTNQTVGLGIHGRGGVVQNQNLRIHEQGAGNTEPLALTAGHVSPTPFNHGVIAILELGDKFMGLSQLAGCFDFGVSGILLTPAHIFLNSPGKEHIGL